MIVLYLAYCIFLIIFCGFFLLIALASSHYIDSDYLAVLIFSTCSFGLTIFLILKKLFTQLLVNTIFFRSLIVCNILAFIYYCYDLLYLNDEVVFSDYSPLLGIALSLLIFIFVKRKNKALN